MEKPIKFLLKHTDKILHIFVSMVIMAFVTSLFSLVLPFWWASLTGAVITTFAGVGKEIYDKEHPEHHSVEWGDILADTLGIVLGFIPLLLIQL